MVSPVALAGASLAASVVGAGTQSQAALQMGQAQAGMYQYQAGIAQLNKKIALQNADYSIAAGESQASQYGTQAAQRFGAIRAAQGASGLDVNSGSAKDVQESQRRVTGIDLNTIRENAARVAYGYQTQAAQEEAQTGLYQKAASGALEAGQIKATASLISGAGSVADKWLQMGQYGLLAKEA